MARIRTIKPEFFVSAQIADVSPTCRLLFIGMWLFCDDAGIHPASPRQLKMEVFPGDDITADQIAAMVGELRRVGLLLEYEVNDGAEVKSYWQVTGWHHQKIERPRFQYPKPDSATCRRHIDDTSTTHRSLTVPDPTVPETTSKREASASARFVAPTVEEVRQYSSEKGLALDAEKFVDHYTAKGWMAGRVKMKDWKATARNASRDGWCKLAGTNGDADKDLDEAFRLRDERRRQRDGVK